MESKRQWLFTDPRAVHGLKAMAEGGMCNEPKLTVEWNTLKGYNRRGVIQNYTLHFSVSFVLQSVMWVTFYIVYFSVITHDTKWDIIHIWKVKKKSLLFINSWRNGRGRIAEDRDQFNKQILSMTFCVRYSYQRGLKLLQVLYSQ